MLNVCSARAERMVAWVLEKVEIWAAAANPWTDGVLGLK